MLNAPRNEEVPNKRGRAAAAHTCRVARLHLIDRVVQNFIHKVVQAALPRAANVHARPLAHWLQALQHLQRRTDGDTSAFQRL